MKKYNLSEIMKRAWGVKKENSENIFSLCLIMAWGEAKGSDLDSKIAEVIECFSYEEKFTKKIFS